MYKNKCIKCGAEFETKNPKRVICPGCLYPDRKDISLQSYSETLKKGSEPENKEFTGGKPDNKQSSGYYTARESRDSNYSGQQREGNFRRPQSNQGGGYRQDGPRQSGYRQDGQRPYSSQNQGGYRQDGPRPGGFRRPQSNQGGGYRQDGPRPGGFRRPQSNQGGFRQSGPRRPAAANKKLLISREQVDEIEKLYSEMLPLPNPDCHEVIGEKMGLESNKVFFGINLVRIKLNLPKLPYPKRKLAVSTEQLMAIKMLYEPLLPLPPIGCHKIIAKQLKIDEWRVHVGIGIIRKQMDLPRWNTDREDVPAEFKNQASEEVSKKETKKTNKTKKSEE